MISVGDMQTIYTHAIWLDGNEVSTSQCNGNIC